MDLEKASRRAAAAASDTKHGQTAWRPPVSFVPAPASRRPRNVHRPTAPPTRFRSAPNQPIAADPRTLLDPATPFRTNPRSRANFSLERRNVVSTGRLISLPTFSFFLSISIHGPRMRRKSERLSLRFRGMRTSVR